MIQMYLWVYTHTFQCWSTGLYHDIDLRCWFGVSKFEIKNEEFSVRRLKVWNKDSLFWQNGERHKAFSASCIQVVRKSFKYK